MASKKQKIRDDGRIFKRNEKTIFFVQVRSKPICLIGNNVM